MTNTIKYILNVTNTLKCVYLFCNFTEITNTTYYIFTSTAKKIQIIFENAFVDFIFISLHVIILFMFQNIKIILFYLRKYVC